MDKEFAEKCMSQRTIVLQPTAQRIEDSNEVRRLTEQHNHNAAYFLEGAANLLRSSTPRAAVILAYFAMEHKANQLLAMYGYKVASHTCTQMGLSRIVQRSDLAKQLSAAFLLRQNIGYRLDLAGHEEGLRETEKFMDEIVHPFIEEIDILINKML